MHWLEWGKREGSWDVKESKERDMEKEENGKNEIRRKRREKERKKEKWKEERADFGMLLSYG